MSERKGQQIERRLRTERDKMMSREWVERIKSNERRVGRGEQDY